MEKDAEKVVEEAENDEEVSEVRFSIKDYNDLFSDFDPRQISQRGLSEDFLFEAKKACAVKAEKIDFIFTMPKKERDTKEEERIIERLKKYFKKHYEILQAKKGDIIKRGVYFTISGIFFMILATYLLFRFKNENLLASFFTILLEPAGWFIFWHGLDNVIFEPQEINADLDFHKKMANARISFVSV